MTETTELVAAIAAGDEEGQRPSSPGPNELRDPLVRQEMKRAAVWIGMAVTVALIYYLSEPLLLIFGGVVFAAMLDGGARLLGRVLPIGRGWRLAIVALGVVAFLAWVVMLAGSSLTDQFDTLRATIQVQSARLLGWAEANHLVNGSAANELGKQLVGSAGKVTSALGTAAGAITSGVMIIVIGLFIAIEPKLYERGIAWMLPTRTRDAFFATMQDMAPTLRRLMAGRLVGMAVEGFGVWVMLALGGIPMAALLGVLTGLLAFLPNIGAIVSGTLVILVGFSAGTHAGFYAMGVYVVVQVIDGYLIVPMVARRAVDLAPALVLGAQLLLGALFGLLGLMFADPMVAMLKVWFEHGAGRNREKQQVATGPSTLTFNVTHQP